MSRTTGIAALCIFLLLQSAFTEEVRGPLSGTVVPQIPGYRSQSMSAGAVYTVIEQLVAIESPEEATLVSGLEIVIDIPAEIAAYRDSFALYLYHNVSPSPNTGIGVYQGRRMLYDLLPPGKRCYIRVPLVESFSFPTSPDTLTIDTTVSIDSFPLLLTIIPIMKGIPTAVPAAEIGVSARTMPAKRGALDVTFAPPVTNEPVTLWIDEKRVSITSNPFILDPGLYELRVESEAFSPYTRSFGIEAGKYTTVTVPLIRQVPLVRFEAPEGTVIYIDGELISSNAFGTGLEIEEGEHVILYKVGDYQVTKRFSAVAGKTYTASISLEIFIQED
jgi:hypothetical protein